VRAVPGEIYGLSQSVRADATGQQARLQINWLDADGAIVDVTLSLVPVFPDWRRHRVYATAPPGASIAEVYAGAHGGSTVYFDEMAFGPIQ
jgi:hypothetical protein